MILLRENLTAELVWRNEDRIHGGQERDGYEVTGGDLLGHQRALEH